MALAGLERYEEALTEYFQCFLLEDSCSKFLKMEIVKVFQLIITAGSGDKEDPPRSPGGQVKFYGESERGSESSDSEGDTEEEEEEEEGNDVQRARKLLDKNTKLLMTKNKELSNVLHLIDAAVSRLVTAPPKLGPRPLRPEQADKEDLDCSLCFRLVWRGQAGRRAVITMILLQDVPPPHHHPLWSHLLSELSGPQSGPQAGVSAL